MPHGSTKLPSVAVETRRVAPRLRAQKAPPKARVLTWATWAAAPAFRLMRAYPGRSAATIVSTLMMAGIVGNATLMQRGRHPAPLFADPPVEAQAPLPRARPTRSVGAPTETPANGPLVATSGVGEISPSAPASQPRPGVGADEPGRRRERSPGPNTDDTPTGVAAPKPPDPDVMRAQHALLKLGFDVKPDGHLGSETRKALDKFASTHHLAVMPGTLTPRLLQALTAAAGKPQG